MSIKSLSIKNFKGYENECIIPFSDLMIFSGENNHGKSSIYQALLLLNQSRSAALFNNVFGRFPTLIMNGENIKLGLGKDLLNNIENRSIEFTLQYNNESEEYLKYTLSDVSENPDNSTSYFLLEEYSLTLSEKKISLIRKEQEIAVESHNLLSFESYDFRDKFYDLLKDQLPTLNFSEIINGHVFFENARNVTFYERILRQFSIGFDELKYCVNDSLSGSLDWDLIKNGLEKSKLDIESINLIVGLENSELSELTEPTIEYISAFRGFPKYIYNVLEESNPMNTFNKGMPIDIKYDFNKQTKVMGIFDSAIRYWIVEEFKLMDDFKVKEYIDGLISQNLLTKNGKQIPMIHIGFGINQVIPVITKVLLSKSDYIIIDEPEIHLHPSLQSKLADFFLSMIMCGKKIIIETHSEYLIQKYIYLKLLYELENEKHSLYWVNCFKDPYLFQIEHDTLGYIQNKPLGFIDENRKIAKLLSELRLKKLNDDK